MILVLENSKHFMRVDKYMYADDKIVKFCQHLIFDFVSPENNVKNQNFGIEKTFSGLKVAPVITNTKITMVNLN